MIYDGDTFNRGDRVFRVNIEHDSDTGAPWEDNDCHGPVSDWTHCDKKPGERILSSDRSSKRYYDWAGAIKLAKKDGWNFGPEDLATLTEILKRPPTRGDIAAAAVENDFDYLKRWCDDSWSYVGVIVTDLTDDPDVETDYGHALWGIESDSGDYIEEVAHELADEILHEVAAELAREMEEAAAELAAEQLEASEVAYWASRDVTTVWPCVCPPPPPAASAAPQLTRKQVEEALSAHYTKKFRGHVGCFYDKSKRKYCINGASLPSELYGTWTLADHLTPTEARKLIKENP